MFYLRKLIIEKHWNRGAIKYLDVFMEEMVNRIVAVLPGKFLKSLRNNTSHQVGGLFGSTSVIGLITEPLGFVQDA